MGKTQLIKYLSMLYVPSNLPKSEPCDFTQTYNPTTCPPAIAQNLQEIMGLRSNFYTTFANVQQSGDHEMIDNIDWFPLLTYLNKGAELLEYSQQANYPFPIQWESGAYPGSWHTVNDDNEVSATTEILFSRITCALGLLKSTRGHITALRSAVNTNNSNRAKEVITLFMERLLFACVRMYKLNFSSNFIYPGLKNRPGPLECARDYSLSIYMLMEINLSSVMIEKALCQDFLNDTAVKMICDLAINALDKVITTRASFQKFNCPQSAEVVVFCDSAFAYFNNMIYICIYKLNTLMEDGASDKTKDIETLYIENNILANHLFDEKKRLEAQIKQAGTHNFVGSENLKHTLSHWNSELINSMKKSIGKYEAIKDTIDKNRFKSYDINTIKANIIAGEDKVNAFIKKSANIPEN